MTCAQMHLAESRQLRGGPVNGVDLVVTNARIYTANRAQPWADALASAGGRVRAVGARRDVEPLINQGTRVIDAGGRTVIPGFVDAHVHLLFGYQLGAWIDLTDHPTLPEVQRRVRAYARDHPREKVIVGYGFDYQALAQEGLPDRKDLDLAVSDRPVILNAWDGHTAWTNSRFLELARTYFATIGHEVGHPERDSRTGEMTGIFRMSFDLTLPELLERRSLDGLRRMLGAALRFGITTAFDVQVPLPDLGAYERLQAQRELPIRVQVAIYHPPDTPEASYPEFRAASDRCKGKRLRAGAVKLYIDGVQETHTASLLDPYSDGPDSRGGTVYSTEKFASVVRALDQAGFQIVTHACGDGGVRAVLDAYESLDDRERLGSRRHRIEHCENVSPLDLDRFGRLGVVPCMMPHHSSPDFTRRWRQAMGEARWRDAFPWKKLLDRHARLAFSSDWPVADLNPFVHLKTAVTRRDPEGNASPHRVTLAQGIDAYTVGAAYASRCDEERGSLVPGKMTDLLVLSDNPFEQPLELMDKIRVLVTVVDGDVAYIDPDPANTIRFRQQSLDHRSVAAPLDEPSGVGGGSSPTRPGPTG